LWRRAAIHGDESPEQLAFWQSAGHEVDFLCPPGTAIEVKVGQTSPMEFGWFRCMPRAMVFVVGRDRFDVGVIQGITLEDFLLANSTASP
jgi:hypothetical protein